MRSFNALMFAITVAVLFMFVGMPERAAIKAQDDKTEQASPASVEPEITVPVDEGVMALATKFADLQGQLNAVKADVDKLKQTCGELSCKCGEAPKAAPAAPAPQAAKPKAPAAPNAMTRSTNGIVLAPGETLVAIDGKPVNSSPTARGRVLSSAGHWTYPGTIAGHLQSDHGVSVQGLSRQEMLNLHDSLHEGTSVPMAPQTNCPNGNCPTAGSARVPLLFPNLGRKYR